MNNDLVENDGIIELTDVIEEDREDATDQEPVALTDIAAGDLGQEVTSEKLEAALENVIEKKFSGHIEKILFEVMEKVIEKEIADIRQRLKKDLDDIGGT